MGHRNDDIYAQLLAASRTGDERQMRDLWFDYLRTKGETGANPDMLFSDLRNRGYTGALTDMVAAAYAAGDLIGAGTDPAQLGIATYTGSPVPPNKVVTGFGFDPDVIIIRNRTRSNRGWYFQHKAWGDWDYTYVPNNALRTDLGFGVVHVTDGFEVDIAVTNWNWDAEDFVAYALLHGDFFQTVEYAGTGVAQDISVPGLDGTPSMIWVKKTGGTGTGNWVMWHDQMASAGVYQNLNVLDGETADTTMWDNTAPSNGQFRVGTNVEVNESGQTYTAYVFANVASKCSTFTFTGNGLLAGPTVNLGFQPRLTFWRPASSGRTLFADSVRGFDKETYVNQNGTEVVLAELGFTPSASGFQVTTADSDWNSSGIVYNGIAIV